MVGGSAQPWFIEAIIGGRRQVLASPFGVEEHPLRGLVVTDNLDLFCVATIASQEAGSAFADFIYEQWGIEYLLLYSRITHEFVDVSYPKALTKKDPHAT